MNYRVHWGVEFLDVCNILIPLNRIVADFAQFFKDMLPYESATPRNENTSVLQCFKTVPVSLIRIKLNVCLQTGQDTFGTKL